MAQSEQSSVVIKTSRGDLLVELSDNKAPLTTKYFLSLIDQGFYNGGAIYRASQLDVSDGPFLLQGGAALSFLQDARSENVVTIPMLDTVETTGTTGLEHVRGTISFARDLGRSGKVLGEFFICLGDFPSLNEGGRDLHDTQGFPAFGRVVSGLELLDEISSQETEGYTHSPILKGQMLTVPVEILNVYNLRNKEK